MKCGESGIQTKNRKTVKKNENKISEKIFNTDFSDVKSSNISSEKMSKENSLRIENKVNDSDALNSFQKKTELNDNMTKKLVDNINNKIYDLGKSEIKENEKLGIEKNKTNKKSKKKYLKKGEKNKIRKKIYNKQKYYENNKTILYLEDRDKTYMSQYNDESLSVKKKKLKMNHIQKIQILINMS